MQIDVEPKIGGSSPRMRGAQLFDLPVHVEVGIIPADAGSTPSPFQSRISKRDHPRGCGEHDRNAFCKDNSSGSSPRMRGALTFRVNGDVGQRIIPADAGSTPNRPECRESKGDHPRGCGEHLLGATPPLLRLGSSPRMRGAHKLRLEDHRLSRIIPADAGSTLSRSSATPLPRDHPRGCGEHDITKDDLVELLGSSPRMRGAHIREDVEELQRRIIPADAGSTDTILQKRATRRDHPRGCGEHRHARTICPCLMGSSPRMRGAQIRLN